MRCIQSSFPCMLIQKIISSSYVNMILFVTGALFMQTGQCKDFNAWVDFEVRKIINYFCKISCLTIFNKVFCYSNAKRPFLQQLLNHYVQFNVVSHSLVFIEVDVFAKKWLPKYVTKIKLKENGYNKTYLYET